MPGDDSAVSATAPGTPGAGAGRPVGRSAVRRRVRRLIDGGLLLQGGVQGSPVLRLFARWVRRPLLPAVRLWRRNIQLKVVATTLLMSLGVVLLLGFVVIGQVRNGLLDAKVKGAESQATGGFRVAETLARSAGEGTSDGNARDGLPRQNSAIWLNDLVQQMSASGQGAFHVVTLNPPGEGGNVSARAPRGSGNVDAPASVPLTLREGVDDNTGPSRSYTRIIYSDGRPSQPGLAIGTQLSTPQSDRYELYYLFPLAQEEKSLSLVKTTLATAGLFVVVLLGAIAWLVVRQVVTPVRMAAGIAERLSAGRLQERMKVTGEDDIARLGEAFNKMAQNLQLKIQQLEALSRMQRRFVSDVSHELRTPLTTVRMAADVIHEARVDFDPVTARSAELLADQLDRFESLLADLLEISRFDAGAAALEAEPIDLREVVRRVVGGAEPLAERKGTRIRVVGDQQPVIAEADTRRVERVLRNLVVNAVEHGEGRDVVVRLATAGGAVAVAVRDYGVGLKPGEATRVFSRFWRADPARARTTGGTGLGLSIALEDARLHGGWLQAWGEPGGGSQFRLTLPRTADEALRGSPIPLEPEDSRRNRDAAQGPPPPPADGSAVTVPAQLSAAARAVPAPATGRRDPAAGLHSRPGAPRSAASTVPPRAGGPGRSPLPQQGGSTTGTTPVVDPAALPSNGSRVVPRRDGTGPASATHGEATEDVTTLCGPGTTSGARRPHTPGDGTGPAAAPDTGARDGRGVRKGHGDGRDDGRGAGRGAGDVDGDVGEDVDGRDDGSGHEHVGGHGDRHVGGRRDLGGRVDADRHRGGDRSAGGDRGTGGAGDRTGAPGTSAALTGTTGDRPGNEREEPRG
ncbi:MtrAB system histidine kinase MtrB [Streptomyces uncialis]|uniref:MtrAB system histidine kinase MtrB n=1 Tax=Streptomyces uncialis TaxID=1048205 RepID=UPI00381B4F45